MSHAKCCRGRSLHNGEIIDASVWVGWFGHYSLRKTSDAFIFLQQNIGLYLGAFRRFYLAVAGSKLSLPVMTEYRPPSCMHAEIYSRHLSFRAHQTACQWCYCIGRSVVANCQLPVARSELLPLMEEKIDGNSFSCDCLIFIGKLRMKALFRNSYADNIDYQSRHTHNNSTGRYKIERLVHALRAQLACKQGELKRHAVAIGQCLF